MSASNFVLFLGHKLKNFSLLLFLIFFTVLILIIILQDFLIFPELRRSFRPVVPEGVASEIRQMKAGNQLEIWELSGDPSGLFASSDYNTPFVAILFCGNAGGLNGHYYSQSLFSSWGIKTYLIDFPGYGNSTGWPSEQLLNENAKEIEAYILQKEEIDVSRLIIGGTSLGSGVAAYLASEIQPRVLVLFAGYSSMTELVSEMNFIYRMAIPFLKYSLPTSSYVANLKSTSLILAHGTADLIIPYTHVKKIENSYRGNGKLVPIYVQGGSHNNIIMLSKEKVKDALVTALHR